MGFEYDSERSHLQQESGQWPNRLALPLERDHDREGQFQTLISVNCLSSHDSGPRLHIP